jgi:hypothetical protein
MGFLDRFFSSSAKAVLPTLEELFTERQVPLDLPGFDALVHEFDHMNALDRTHWADAIASLHRKNRPLPPPWIDAQYELFPEVVPTWQAEREAYYYRPVLDGLSERVLVAGRLMSEEWLAIWGISAPDVMERALDHLREASKDKPFKRMPSGIYKSTYADGMDAARILLPELLNGMFPGQNMFLCIPTRDHLLVSPQVLLPKLVEAIGQSLEKASNRVLAVIWQHVGGKLMPANLQDPHPIAQPQRDLRQGDLLEAYRVQDQDLDLEAGVPAQVMQLKTQQGRSISTAIWMEGKPVYLPETDAIGFVNAKGQPLGIYFRQTMPRIPELKGTPVDIWGPRRVRYEGFPTQEQLERLEVFANPEQMTNIFAPPQAKRSPQQDRQQPQPQGLGLSSSPLPAHLRGQALGSQRED